MSTSYTYDIANRLDTVTEGALPTISYSWDDYGNLLSDGVYTYTYNTANRLTTINSGQLPVVSYQWDENGNLLDDGENTYAYDKANRLIAVSGEQSAANYAYNGLGDRVQQTVDPSTGSR